VEFLGAKNHPQTFYERSKIFMMTSIWEGFGMTLIEAQHYGSIPFCYNSFSAVYDIIDNGKNGFIINLHDIDDYARKLEMLMENEEQQQIMRNYIMQNSLSKFDITCIANQWKQIFSELIPQT